MKTTIYATLLSIIISLLAGCSAPPSGRVTGSDSPIVSLQQTEDGFEAVAEREAARVTLTVARRGLRPDDFIRDPDLDSPYEADLVARNRHGFPFLASGNHGLPGLAEAGVATTDGAATADLPALDHEEQVADLQLATDAAELLQNQPDVGQPFRWELRSLRHLAAGALSRADDLLTEPAGTRSLQSVGDGATTYVHRVSIRYATCCNSLGHHSAVLLEIFNSHGTFVGAVSTKNHGRDASDPTMVPATGCPRSFGGRTTVFPNFRPYAATDLDYWGSDDAGGCHTRYGLWPGSHVCNDDSQAMYWNLKYNVAGTWATCEDATLRWWAPHCD